MKNKNDDSKAPKPVVKTQQQPSKEIKTDYPLSEKDEVKKAEQNTNKAVKKKS